jgi:hypothetical protein
MSVSHELDRITQQNWANFKRLLTGSVAGVAAVVGLMALFLL